ncbi:hypothetical protein [Rugosimonospora africana]|uniref:PH domain-containing protein n=1 Tax=Rugosimonospora africana TaxID=556532 RepID=A0A8J3VQZ3_9ACTN|nr:hypothetical protein [Rugosimonospora africana]GIH15552.1 hypothetical protein Raf01_37240 [Rugosimonospora africana]
MAERDGAVATFAPTRRQIAVLQLVCVPLVAGLVAAVFVVLKLTAGGPGDAALPLVVVLVLGLLLLVSAQWWTARTAVERTGIRLNDRPWVTGSANFVRWDRVADVTVVRRRRHTSVVLRLGTGDLRTLPAPYDGRGLTRDPGFAAKADLIREAWQAGRGAVE